ncbi:protoporphyrinogen oxidase [Longibacter salinarum]|uniref:Coproporphyrinogen III oxidase n=1 Tax=Longibacter salinarum TaxID=1850348 RepID=A0A2A8CZK9_9BACT|nr:protoporphyrinogen oxidase [Longibacter salinarum]
MSVGIIGAGISGLTAAYHLKQAGIPVTVLEATSATGGMIRSESIDGYLVEHGPNSLRDTNDLLPEIIRDLNLTEEIVEASASARKRYVVKHGKPEPLPSSPLSFLTTSLLSTRGKLRLLMEPFVRSGNAQENETVASFVRRRLGREILDYAVDPFVGGIFAGDPADLSVAHAFSRLHQMEKEHGSLFRGLIHAFRNRSDGGNRSRSIYSFRNGLETLPRALTQALGDCVHVNTPVTSLRLDDRRWHVATREPDGATEMRFFDAVISTIPLHRLPGIDLTSEIDLAPLERVPYPPVSVLAMGFDRSDIDHPLDGFGMLVPKVEDDYSLLGCLFSSTLFPNRAPEGQVLLTTFAGGARHPKLGMEETAELRSTVLQDLDELLGIRGAPSFTRHIQWQRAIPQYTLQHGHVKAVLDRLETRHPGLHFAGNYRSGISVGDAMQSGVAAAEETMHSARSVVTGAS